MHVLYSFRRCPYAIRARIALRYAGIKVELREVELKNKPESMLQLSAKGTVPVLLESDGNVIDESLDIMLWALSQSDTEQWICEKTKPDSLALIEENDNIFKHWLDRYKYFDRYPEHPQDYYLSQCLEFIAELEAALEEREFLLERNIKLADVAIFPFVRQFAFVDKTKFDLLPFPKVQRWLAYFLNHELFMSSMKKFKPWQEGTPGAIL